LKVTTVRLLHCWTHAVAAYVTTLCGVQKLHTTALRHRTLSLQKPPRDHPGVMGRLHAKFGPDPLKTIVGFGEQSTGTTQKYP